MTEKKPSNACTFGGEHGEWVMLGGRDPFTNVDNREWCCGKCGKPSKDIKKGK